MSRKEDYEELTQALVAPLLDEYHFWLWDIEYVKEGQDYFLRIFIDKEGGITIDDCEVFSRRVSDMLDEKDFIPDAYIFEVSSPGLGRALKKDKHFEMCMGEEIEVKLYKELEKKKVITGILTKYEGGNITVERDGKETMIPKELVAKVNLTFDF